MTRQGSKMYRVERVATDRVSGEVVGACLGLDGIPVRLVREREGLQICANDLVIPVPLAASSAHLVDVLGDQYILVRPRVPPGDYQSLEKNAWIITKSGELVRTLALTGRFSGIATDYSRRIWTRYEDQTGFWMPPPVRIIPEIRRRIRTCCRVRCVGMRQECLTGYCRRREGSILL